jgi:hypothetical protein
VPTGRPRWGGCSGHIITASCCTKGANILASLWCCQMVRSGQPTGVLILVVYLLGREESKAKNSKVTHKYGNTENTTSLYWFGPLESNTLRPVVGVDCLGIV